jgi:hypothetical protein
MENDPEELDNLYPSNPSFVAKMREELFSALSAANDRVVR